jgi:hypothetical protein
VAFGNVYVFNLYTEPAGLILNGQGPAGTIPAPDRSSGAPYTPSQVAVPRTNLTQDQLSGQIAFCQGDNYIGINFGGQQWQLRLTVPSPPNPPLEADLCLYLAYGNAYLFTAYGTPIQAPGGRAAFPLTRD